MIKNKLSIVSVLDTYHAPDELLADLKGAFKQLNAHRIQSGDLVVYQDGLAIEAASFNQFTWKGQVKLNWKPYRKLSQILTWQKSEKSAEVNTALSTIRFYGSSDDNFCFDGLHRDEIGCFDSLAIVKLYSPSTKESMLVCGQYGAMPGSTWFIGVSQVDEDIPMPSWPVMIQTADRSYSPELFISVPPDTVWSDVSDA